MALTSAVCEVSTTSAAPESRVRTWSPIRESPHTFGGEDVPLRIAEVVEIDRLEQRVLFEPETIQLFECLAKLGTVGDERDHRSERNIHAGGKTMLFRIAG